MGRSHQSCCWACPVHRSVNSDTSFRKNSLTQLIVWWASCPHRGHTCLREAGWGQRGSVFRAFWLRYKQNENILGIWVLIFLFLWEDLVLLLLPSGAFDLIVKWVTPGSRHCSQRTYLLIFSFSAITFFKFLTKLVSCKLGQIFFLRYLSLFLIFDIWYYFLFDMCHYFHLSIFI